MTTTRRAVYRAPERIEVEEAEAAGLAPGGVRLRVEVCGVCGSDVATYLHGHYVVPGQVPGHEAVATVVESAGAELAPGARVAPRPLRTCGTCWYCRRGERHLCGASGRMSLGYGLPGAFADELVVADADGLYELPGDVDALDAVWIEPLAVALHGVERAGIGPGSDVLVVGAGPVGLCAIAAARAAGGRVEAVEPRAGRREAALAAGASRAVAPGDPVGAADAALDASGHPAAIAAAAARLRPGGTLVLLGLADAPLEPPPPSVRVRGSFAYRERDFRRAVALVSTGRIRLGSLVTHRFPLPRVGEAIAAAARDDSAVKVVVELDRPVGRA